MFPLEFVVLVELKLRKLIKKQRGNRFVTPKTPRQLSSKCLLGTRTCTCNVQ